MDDDAGHDLESSTRALQAELRARETSQPMSEAELDRLVECGVGLERALRRAQVAGTPITEEAVLVWDRARQFVDEHDHAQVLGRARQQSDAPDEPGRN